MTLHLVISGKVQGVFYRANAKEEADKLNIKGWIKNTPDDKVEALITGSEEDLMQFVTWCKKGSARAMVTDVMVTEVEEESFPQFKIIR